MVGSSMVTARPAALRVAGLVAAPAARDAPVALRHAASRRFAIRGAPAWTMAPPASCTVTLPASTGKHTLAPRLGRRFAVPRTAARAWHLEVRSVGVVIARSDWGALTHAAPGLSRRLGKSCSYSGAPRIVEGGPKCEGGKANGNVSCASSCQ